MDRGTSCRDLLPSEELGEAAGAVENDVDIDNASRVSEKHSICSAGLLSDKRCRSLL